MSDVPLPLPLPFQVFNANRACRMFLEGKCPFEKGCANIHICREFYALYVNVLNPHSINQTPAAGGFELGSLQDSMNSLNLGMGNMGNMGNMQPLGMQGMGGMAGFDLGNEQNMGATGADLMGGGEVKGIPLYTDEGPVPTELLPESVCNFFEQDKTIRSRFFSQILFSTPVPKP